MRQLTFQEFRAANVKRCLKWHPQGIESWSPSDWLTAVTGELGELASLLKMRNRERDGLPGNKFSPTQKQIADEVADVFTYLDLLAEVLGVDTAAAVVEKFNAVSARVGFPDRIDSEAPGESPAPTPEALDLATCADWLEQAGRTGANSDMSHPALVAWAKAGYPDHFSRWVCGEIASRLRSLPPSAPDPLEGAGHG